MTLGRWCQNAKWCQCEPVMCVYSRIANLVPTSTGMEIAYSKLEGGGVGGVIVNRKWDTLCTPEWECIYLCTRVIQKYTLRNKCMYENKKDTSSVPT